MGYMSTKPIMDVLEIQALEDIGNGNHRVILRDGTVASFKPDGTVTSVPTDQYGQDVKVIKRDEQSFDTWPSGFEHGTDIGGSQIGKLWAYRLP
jgi:hypothetical protein